MKRIYVDTEYIYEGMFQGRTVPKKSYKKQIIQIAAVLFDHDQGVELEKFNILVKPIFHEKLPDFFIRLTKINDEMIKKKAVSFPEAFEQFNKFCENYPIWTFNNDYAVFLQNLKFHSISNPFKRPFIKVKPLLKNYGIDADKYSSGTLYRAAGLKLKGHVHDALHDVRSMSRAMYELEKNLNP